MFAIHVSFIITLLYIVWRLICTRHALSFYNVFYIFALFFYSIAPYAQFVNQAAPWPIADDVIFLKTNLILLICFVLYDLFYQFSWRNKVSVPENFSKKILSPQGVFVLLFIVLLWGAIFFYLSGFSLKNLLLRGGDVAEQRKDISQTMSLFSGSFRFSFSVITFLMFIFCENKYAKIFSFLLLLFFAAPTAGSRHFAAASYMPLMIIIIPVLLKSRYMFTGVMIFSLLVIFPFLNMFRYAELSEKPTMFEQFTSLHFDSYISFAFVLENDIVTYGRQLLGPLFFWVPRSVWADKPEGSGHMVANTYQLFDGGFSNVSMNYLGEGYINFGSIGVLGFIVLLAVFSKKMDVTFWEKYRGDYHNFFAAYYFYAMIMLFFCLRGDLLSGSAFICGMVFVIFLYTKICQIFLKRDTIKYLNIDENSQ